MFKNMFQQIEPLPNDYQNWGRYKSRKVKVFHPEDAHLSLSKKRLLFEYEIDISSIADGIALYGFEIKYKYNLTKN